VKGSAVKLKSDAEAVAMAIGRSFYGAVDAFDWNKELAKIAIRTLRRRGWKKVEPEEDYL